MQREILLSADPLQDGEAAQRSGCLAIFLWQPFSTVFFGTILILGLMRVPIHSNLGPSYSARLSAIFTPQVLRWEPQIIQWASENELDPNLVATVMQIESCGDPNAMSSAGAMGLFQVMPYHFAEGEDPFSFDTNATRGLDYLSRSLEEFHGEIGLALAGYNGGIQSAKRLPSEWAQETIDYEYWGENIYADAASGHSSSPALEQWLAAGGASLCAQAEVRATAAR